MPIGFNVFTCDLLVNLMFEDVRSNQTLISINSGSLLVIEEHSTVVSAYYLAACNLGPYIISLFTRYTFFFTI